MRRLGQFGAAVAGLILLMAWGTSVAVKDAAAAHGVWVSAWLAIAVQCAAFSLTRVVQPAQIMAAWGAGMILRFMAVAAYSLVGVKMLGLAQAPALLSFAGFLFVTTLVEPVFLRP